VRRLVRAHPARLAGAAVRPAVLRRRAHQHSLAGLHERRRRERTARRRRGRRVAPHYNLTMAHTNPGNDELRQLLTSATTIAMVGASGNPEKPSHGIMQKLQHAGYRVIPVNPREPEI